MKYYDTQFDEIILTFTNQNSRKFEIPDKINSLLTNRSYVLFYRNKKRKMYTRICGFFFFFLIFFFFFFFSFARNYRKHLLGTGLDPLKTAAKKVVNKVAGGTGEVIRNKYVDKIVK